MFLNTRDRRTQEPQVGLCRLVMPSPGNGWVAPWRRLRLRNPRSAGPGQAQCVVEGPAVRRALLLGSTQFGFIPAQAHLEWHSFEMSPRVLSPTVAQWEAEDPGGGLPRGFGSEADSPRFVIRFLPFCSFCKRQRHTYRLFLGFIAMTVSTDFLRTWEETELIYCPFSAPS